MIARKIQPKKRINSDRSLDVENSAIDLEHLEVKQKGDTKQLTKEYPANPEIANKQPAEIEIEEKRGRARRRRRKRNQPQKLKKKRAAKLDLKKEPKLEEPGNRKIELEDKVIEVVDPKKKEKRRGRGQFPLFIAKSLDYLIACLFSRNTLWKKTIDLVPHPDLLYTKSKLK